MAVTARLRARPAAGPAASPAAPPGSKPGPAAARGRERAGDGGLFHPAPPPRGRAEGGGAGPGGFAERPGPWRAWPGWAAARGGLPTCRLPRWVRPGTAPWGGRWARGPCREGGLAPRGSGLGAGPRVVPGVAPSGRVEEPGPGAGPGGKGVRAACVVVPRGGLCAGSTGSCLVLLCFGLWQRKPVLM